MIRFGKPRLVGIISFLIVFQISAAHRLEASGRKGWSVDLKDYGYKEWRDRKNLYESSRTALAVANNLVAVALANPSSESQTGVRGDHEKWEISLLLFDAPSGKLRAKGGPWTGDPTFDLFSASGGNLLLLLRHVCQAFPESGETLLLLSPDGNELKKLELAPSVLRSKNMWNDLLVSSSGRTVLVAQRLEGSTQYKLLDVNTLAPQSEWTAEKGSNAPGIIALSDTELLGFASPNPSQDPDAAEHPEFYVRTFSGVWNRFPARFDLTQRGFLGVIRSHEVAFLSDQTLVGINAKRDDPEAPILVLRTDGSKVFSPVLQKLEARTFVSGHVSVTHDGRYFAVAFNHRPWLSHLMLDVWQLDDTFTNDELVLVVWAASEPAALAKFNLGSAVDAREFSLGVDDSPFLAVLGRSSVKLLRIQRER